MVIGMEQRRLQHGVACRRAISMQINRRSDECSDSARICRISAPRVEVSMKTGSSSGFALLLVLWTLVILSTIALTLAASIGTEVHASQEAWNELQAERLANAGHEFAAYLETRGLGTPGEDFTGLTVESVIAGLRYRVTVDVGTIDVVFEGENGKFDLAAASDEERLEFFAQATGESDRGRAIAAAIADWVDPDDDMRPLGAEAPQYLNRGYRPRNNVLGAADLFLVNGMKEEDLIPSINGAGEIPRVRQPLMRAISSVSSGNLVNPNYALPVVIRSLPGMTPETLARILENRQRSIFTDLQDFRARVGMAEDSALLSRFTFNRGVTPSVLAIGRPTGSTMTRTERRTRSQSPDRRQGSVPITYISLIEHGASVE
jgi:general secretion pathway protein K